MLSSRNGTDEPGTAACAPAGAAARQRRGVRGSARHAGRMRVHAGADLPAPGDCRDGRIQTHLAGPRQPAGRGAGAGCTNPAVDGRRIRGGGERVASPDRDPLPMTADAVYPAGIENTVAFMATLPETPCEALLDIGTGTGIAALDGARLARHAWGTDIAARSVQFAEFNRRLNGIENACVLMGDLYAPVELGKLH